MHKLLIYFTFKYKQVDLNSKVKTNPALLFWKKYGFPKTIVIYTDSWRALRRAQIVQTSKEVCRIPKAISSSNIALN